MYRQVTIEDVIKVMQAHKDLNHTDDLKPAFDSLNITLIERGMSHYSTIESQTASTLSDIEDQLMTNGNLPVAKKQFLNPVETLNRRKTPLEEINEMDQDQLDGKRSHLESYFNGCRDGGHGISTKERVWYNRVCDRLEQEFGQDIDRWH